MLSNLLVLIALFPLSSLCQSCGSFDYLDPDSSWPQLACDEPNQCDKSDFLQQSPVLVMSSYTNRNLKPLQFTGYSTFVGNLTNLNEVVSVSVPEDKAGTLTFKSPVKHGKDSVYRLVEIEIHSLAENVLYNYGQDVLAFHLVHRSDSGDTAILALHFRSVPFQNITTPWAKSIIDSIGVVDGGDGTLTVGSLQDFFDELLNSQNNGYYHFTGSLTTPPCTEGVQWYVLDATAVISSDDLVILQQVVYPNARPIQRTLVDVDYYDPIEDSTLRENMRFLRNWVIPSTVVVVVIGVSICVLLILLIIISRQHSEEGYNRY